MIRLLGGDAGLGKDFRGFGNLGNPPAVYSALGVAGGCLFPRDFRLHSCCLGGEEDQSLVLCTTQFDGWIAQVRDDRAVVTAGFDWRSAMSPAIRVIEM